VVRLVSPSLRGVDLPRSPATIRLLATEIIFDSVRMLGHRTFSEQEDRHSLSFLVHAEFKKPKVYKAGGSSRIFLHSSFHALKQEVDWSS